MDTATSSEPSPSPPAPAQSGQVWIDLTNSPEPAGTKPTSLKGAVGKTPSFDRRHSEFVEGDEVRSAHQDQTFHTTKIGRVHKTVEKLPLPPLPSNEPESVSSTPRRTKQVRGTKVRKLSSPIRLRQPPLGNGKNKHLEEKTIRSRAIRTCRLDRLTSEYSFRHI